MPVYPVFVNTSNVCSKLFPICTWATLSEGINKLSILRSRKSPVCKSIIGKSPILIFPFQIYFNIDWYFLPLRREPILPTIYYKFRHLSTIKLPVVATHKSQSPSYRYHRIGRHLSCHLYYKHLAQSSLFLQNISIYISEHRFVNNNDLSLHSFL